MASSEWTHLPQEKFAGQTFDFLPELLIVAGVSQSL